MKFVLTGIFAFLFSFATAQDFVPKDLKFDTKIVNTENHYVVFPPKQGSDSLIYGALYFLPESGYTFKYFGSLKFKDNDYSYGKDERDNSIVAEWQNLGLDVAFLPEEQVKNLKLPEPEKFLKNNAKTSGKKDEILRAKAMNGLNFPEFSLPILERHYSEKKFSEDLYFELAYAYDLQKEYAKAEKILKEAYSKGYKGDYILTETHSNLLFQEKGGEAGLFLEKHFNNFKDNVLRSSLILNQIHFFYNKKQFPEARVWLETYKTKVGNDRYKNTIDQFDIALNQLNQPKK